MSCVVWGKTRSQKENKTSNEDHAWVRCATRLLGGKHGNPSLHHMERKHLAPFNPRDHAWVRCATRLLGKHGHPSLHHMERKQN